MPRNHRLAERLQFEIFDQRCGDVLAHSVFTNQPNYNGSGGNGSTTGIFGGAGATTQPLSGAPGY